VLVLLVLASLEDIYIVAIYVLWVQFVPSPDWSIVPAILAASEA